MDRGSELHHAYLLVGDREVAHDFVEQLFEKLGQPLKGSPDFFVISDEVFGVDKARELSELSLRKAFGSHKVFLITPRTITLEAQNALLKTFEEPPQGTHFFLVLRETGRLIPTLLSRVSLVKLDSQTSSLTEAEAFLSAPLKKRLAFVKKFIDAERPLLPFLDELLTLSRNPLVYRMRLAGEQQSAAPRLILEHLALAIKHP